ncbi:MAG: hypothetical protein PHG87_04465 [Candidatus Omnitrophica bacterium]|nr:hypothetical protein [Candidatus Omnitrophota bacterium]
MCMVRLSHLLAIVPISILLTISFFVLFVMRKVEDKALKTFGYVVVSFLWLAALVVFSGAVYKTAKGAMAMKCMMHKDSMPAMSMPEKGQLPKDDKKPAVPRCGANKGIIFKAQ